MAKRKLKVLAALICAVVFIVGFWWLCWLAAPLQAQGNAPQRRLEIASIDISGFPQVALNLIATDAQSRPLRDLGGLQVRENSVPIDEFNVVPLTAGVNLHLIVDANQRIQEAEDESGITRLQKVKDSILLYAGRFMDLAQRDHITVIVPDDDGGRLLIADESDPSALIDAVRAYDPGRLPQSDPHALLDLALEEVAAQRSSGRFQAIVLYTDAAGLNSFRFPPLVERARELQTPIFILLLGGVQPNEDALQEAADLAEATRGSVAHMPAATDSSELLQVVADNGVQSQVAYRSNLTRSGVYSVSVTLNRQRDDARLELALAPPEIRLRAPQTTIVRAGVEPDAPLEDLQPSVQPVELLIAWPDGLPRSLQGASLLAGGEAQDAPFFSAATPGAGELLQFDWSIRDLNAGRYALSAVVTDTLGIVARSNTVEVAIELARPDPRPTPQPTATPQPLQFIRELLPPLSLTETVRPFVAPAGALLLLVLVFFGVWRRRQATADVAMAPAARADHGPPDDVAEAPVAARRQRVFLRSVPDGRTVALDEANVTIGREEKQVQLHLPDDSVSPLHARIRRRDGDYWLYDEGSQQGTLLNHERLGLAPRLLKHGDEIQIGRVRFVFLVVKVGDDEVAHVGREDEGNGA